MNLEIRAEFALFPEKEYINGIFVTVYQDPYYGLPLVMDHLNGDFLKYFFEHCFTCRPSDSAESELRMMLGWIPCCYVYFGIDSQSL
jgi:hypothetical protein